MSFLYKRTIQVVGQYIPQQMQPLWNHPAGPKTVFFWAPVFKWLRYRAIQESGYRGLVIASIGDLARPAEKLSISQSSALAATGVIWARYSLVIIPKNWSLFSVNVFVGATNIYQLSRAIRCKQDMAVKSS